MMKTAVNYGDTVHIAFDVPLDQAPGVHWYHSLSPGVESLHVMGGLFGAILVDPLVPTETLPPALLAMKRSEVCGVSM
jgi:hypothetical protein